MKKAILTFFLVGLTLGLMAQSSTLKFRSLNGEKFWLVVNDLRKNFNPEPAVTITDFPKSEASVSLVFERASLGQIKTELYLTPGTEVSYVIHPLNFRGASPTEVILAREGDMLLAVDNIKVTDAVSRPPEVTETTELPPVEEAPTEISTTKTNPVTTKTNTENPVEVADPDVLPTEETITANTQVVEEEVIDAPAEPEIIHYVDGYTGPYGCDKPMSEEDYKQARNNIKSRPYASSKMSTAKQVVRTHNCVTVAQIKGIIGIFSFESDRLEFAKFAYPYTYDKGNYGNINDAFTFESSISDLNGYIGKLK